MSANTVSYIKFLQKVKAFADDHYQIKRIEFDFDEQLSSVEEGDKQFPLLYIAPVSNTVRENTSSRTVRVYCVDLKTQGRENVNYVVSDTDLILEDLYRYFKDGNDNDIEVVNEPVITPINNALLDSCVGSVMDITFEVANIGYCAIPLSPTTPVDECEALLNSLSATQLNECILPSYDFASSIVLDNLTVQQVNDLETEFGGGGCGEIEVYVRDENGQEIPFIIDPDVSTIITLDNVTVNAKNSANTTIGTGLVSPIIGGNVTVNDIIFTDTDNTTSSKAAGTNFSATLIPALSAAQLNNTANGLTTTQRDNLNRLLDIKTGQTISYRTGDDGDIEQGSLQSFVVLAAQNPYGNSNRFTDTLGGQTYSNGIIVDWSRRLMWYNPNSTGNWNTAIDASEASTQGGFTDWHIPNAQQAQSIVNYGNSGGVVNYTPFNWSFTSFWTSTTSPDTTTNAFRTLTTGATTAGGITQSGKTTTNSFVYCRIFSLSDLGL